MLDQAIYKKTAIAAGVVTLLAIQGGMAYAQTAPAEGGIQIQEVIVTAQRIAQPASKTPVALSVLSGDELKQAGAVNASSLSDLVPNVQIANLGGATTISIRGVSSVDPTEKGDPSASFNIDGVNFARPQSAGVAFYDLERVEVLRGPQGTLYGRNSTAGAINLITNKPEYKFDSSAAIELGNYHSTKFDGMLNVKVNDVLALRGAISTSKHDGYLRSTQGFAHNYDDDDSVSARIHALFKFNPDMSLLLSVDNSTQKGAGAGDVPYDTFLHKTGKAQRTASPSVQGFMDNRSRGASAEFKANTAAGELTYQAAHRTLDQNVDQAVGQAIPNVLTPDFRIIANYKQTSHELRLASAFGNWKTIGGLYWFREQIAMDARLYNFPVLGTLAFLQNPTISQSKAVFGDATYGLTQDMHVVVGLRRTNDDKSRQGQVIFGDPVTFRGVNDAAVSYAQTTGKLGVDYALSKKTMLYATYSTGYKAGGFNDGTAATNPFLKYDPERLSSFEIGIKGRFLDNRLQINADVFSYAYKGLQLSSIVDDPVTGARSQQTRNAASASVSGLEVDGKYALGSSGRITFSATALDAHFKSYMPTPTANWSGRRLEKSPRSTVSLGYSHNWNFDNGGTLTGYIGRRYSSSYVVNDYGNAEQLTQGASHKSDMNLNYAPAGDKWSLQAFVRNIEDKAVMTGYTAASGGRPATANLAPPRTVGVRLLGNF